MRWLIDERVGYIDVQNESPTHLLRSGVPDRERNFFPFEADVTVYWPWVRPCWEERTLEP